MNNKNRDIYYLKRISQKFRPCSHLKLSKKGRKEKHSKGKSLSRSSSSHDIYKNLNIFSRTNNYPYLPYFSPIFFHLKQPGLVIIHPLHCNKNPFILDNVIRTHVSLHRRFSPFLLFRDPPERGQERRFTRTQSFEAKREEKDVLLWYATD